MPDKESLENHATTALASPEPRIGAGKPGPGRPKGVPNKTTTAQRHAIHEAFEALGGVQALTEYAKKDPKGFFAIWGRTIPSKVEGTGDGGELVIVIRRDDR